jgi:Pyridoxamine 5'-phosphate oxidase
MIDQPLADFLQQGLGIHLGTRDAQLRPNGARVAAVKVEEDRLHVVAYISRVAARRLLADLEANGQAALVFGRPIDDRACQVKGEFVSVRPAAGRERPFIDAQWQGFLNQLQQIGIPPAAAAGWVTWPALAIRLRVTELFNQTPGPDAGAPL